MRYLYSIRFKHLWISILISCVVLPGFPTEVNGQTITTNQVGQHNGYYYQFWKESPGTGSLTLGTGGAYSGQWSNVNLIFFGKGKRPGSKTTVVNYATTVFNVSGVAYLGVHGWTTSPLVEYYIVDSWGAYRPTGGRLLGTVATDGGIYDIFKTTRNNQPAINGVIANYDQYWNVRRSKRTSGTITCANHFDAWSRLGLPLGNLYEVMLQVQAFQGSGRVNVSSMSMSDGAVKRMAEPENDIDETLEPQRSDRDLVFANPAFNGVLKIDVAEGISEIKMTDLNGKALKAIIVSGQRTLTLQLDVQPGIYILCPYKGLQQRKPLRLIVKN